VVNPTLYGMAWNGGYEILLSFLLCLAVLLIWLQMGVLSTLNKGLQIVIALSSGFLLGLAALVASKLVLVILTILGTLIILRFRFTLAVFLGSLTPLTLWSLRNSLVLSNPSPLNSNGPINLWIGNNPDATLGGYMTPPELPSGSTSRIEATINHVISQPEFTIALTMRKVARLAEPTYIYPSDLLPPQMLVILHVLTALLSLGLLFLVVVYSCGRLWAAPPITPPVGLLAITIISFVVIHIPFLAEARFRTPVEPLVVAVAVPTAVYLQRRIRTFRVRKSEA